MLNATQIPKALNGGEWVCDSCDHQPMHLVDGVVKCPECGNEYMAVNHTSVDIGFTVIRSPTCPDVG